MAANPRHDKTSSSALRKKSSVVVLDVETTGKYPQSDTLTEVAAQKIPVAWFEAAGADGDGEVKGETFTTLVNPCRPISDQITELTGINDSMVQDAPTLEGVLPQLLEFCSGHVIVAHNAVFDLSFLAASCRTLQPTSENAKLQHLGAGRLESSTLQDGPSESRRLGDESVQFLDTLKMSRKVLGKNLPNHRLSTLAAHYHAPLQPTHRALADVQATAYVLKGLVADASTMLAEKKLLPNSAARTNTSESASMLEPTLFPQLASWSVTQPFIRSLATLEDILR